jgi:hypothetical protein
MRKVNKITGFVFFILGILIIVGSSKLEYVRNGLPGPGFFPLWLGIIIALLALGLIITSFLKNKKSKDDFFEITKKELNKVIIIIGSSVLCIFFTQIIGLIPSLGLMTGAIAFLLGENRLKVVISLTILTPIVLYLIFVVGLKVHMPMGLFNYL